MWNFASSHPNLFTLIVLGFPLAVGLGAAFIIQNAVALRKFRRSATCIQLLTWWCQLTQHPWSKWELSDVEFDAEWRYCKRCGAMENRRIGPPTRHWNCRCEITPLEHEQRSQS